MVVCVYKGGMVVVGVGVVGHGLWLYAFMWGYGCRRCSGAWQDECKRYT